MQIVLATTNKGKIKEIKQMLPNHNVLSFSEILGDLEVEETGSTFEQNAKIKASTIYSLLKDKIKDLIVISDDSGLSIEALDWRPNIFSARYAGENANDQTNRQKVILELQKLGIEKSNAYYTAAIAIMLDDEIFVTHGWCHGEIITQEKGANGFGYDPIFIPSGYTQTFGELDESLKKTLSHRAKALKLAMILINSKIKN